MDLENIRTALIITLSILAVVVALRKFKRSVLAKDMPAVLHAELLALELVYHPARIFVEVKVPDTQQIQFNLLDASHTVLHPWNAVNFLSGRHSLELLLPEQADGTYFLEMRTDTQRTMRQFRLQRQ